MSCGMYMSDNNHVREDQEISWKCRDGLYLHDLQQLRNFCLLKVSQVEYRMVF